MGQQLCESSCVFGANRFQVHSINNNLRVEEVIDLEDTCEYTMLLSETMKVANFSSPFIFPRKVRERHSCWEISSLDDIYVSYSSEWPICLIISPEILREYNKVWSFLLKVLPFFFFF